MRTAKLMALAIVAAALPACSTFNLNLHDTPPEFPDAAVLDWQFTTDALGEYDGNILDASFLGTGERKGELVMVDLWPFVGVGVGLVGARIRILPLEIGLGIGFSAPSQATGDGCCDHMAAE